MGLLFALLIIYQIKHFLADYPLQGKYMLGKFKPGWDFLGPLAAHCIVHGLFTFLIAKYCGYSSPITLAFIDFSIHFVMDRIKASPKYLGRFKAVTKDQYEDHMENIASLRMQEEMVLEAVRRYPETTVNDIGFSHDLYSVRKELENAHRDWYYKMQSNTFFWWSLGLDQMVHHLTHYYLIAKIMGLL